MPSDPEVTERTSLLKIVLNGVNDVEKGQRRLEAEIREVGKKIVQIETDAKWEGKEKSKLESKLDEISQKIEAQGKKLDEHARRDADRWVQFEGKVTAIKTTAEEAKALATDILTNGSALSRKHEGMIQTGKAAISNSPKWAYVILLIVALLGGGPGSVQIIEDIVDAVVSSSHASPSPSK